MPILSRKNCNFAFQREATGNRRGDPTTLSEDDLIPFEVFEEIDLPETFEEFTEYWRVNAGRNVSDMIGESIPVVDGSINFELISGIPFKYALGKCVTTVGKLETTTITTIADIAGSLNNTYFTFTVVDSNTDDVKYYCWFNVNAAGVDPAPAGWTYGLEVALATGATANDVAAAAQLIINAVVSMTATNPGAPSDQLVLTNDELGLVTATTDTGATGFGFVRTLAGVDNLHTITEDDDTDLPSLALYYQQLYSAAADALMNLIGVHCNELTLAIKKDAHIKGTFACKVPKSIISDYNGGAAITTLGTNTVGGGAPVAWSAFKYPNKIFEWAHLKGNWTLILDAGDYIGSGAVDASGWGTESAELKITNDLDLLPVMGDPNNDAPNAGKREHEIVIFFFPETDVGRLLRKIHPENYSCTLVAKIARGTRDYVQLTYSNLYVKNYPNKIPSIDDKSVGLEMTLRNNVGGTLAIAVKDKKGKIFYEVY